MHRKLFNTSGVEMETKCQGKNCTSTDGRNHSVECLFEHFMSYTAAHNEPEAVQEKLKKAYFDGYEAGVGRQEGQRADDWYALYAEEAKKRAKLRDALEPFAAIDLLECRLPPEFAMLVLRARGVLTPNAALTGSPEAQP